MEDRQNRYCIIGAGPCGLAAAKNFLQWRIPFDAFERQDDVGGNWCYGKPSSSVYDSTHLISSRRMTEYTDFPMPSGLPPYPNHRQVHQYLRSYADHFGLYDAIQFNKSVVRAQPLQEGRWRVELDDGRVACYRGLVIANGHHWDPRWPELPGEPAGEMIHARQYKTPDQLRGKRVLVVGGGNSGCDIAVEAAQNADAAFLSLRRGYHFLPKFLFGSPIDSLGDRMNRWRLPLWLQRWVTSLLVRVALGKPEKYGLPAPDHRLFETHPIINSQLLYYVGHGDIQVRPAVKELRDDRVLFEDGREERIDLIICATGYKLSFPFIDGEHLNWGDGRPRLYLHAFHPLRDDLFVAGMIQPNSGLWGLADLQTQLMAAFLHATDANPEAAERFRQRKQRQAEDVTAGIRYVDSPRHQLEVEYFTYRQTVTRLVEEFGPKPPPRSSGCA